MKKFIVILSLSLWVVASFAQELTATDYHLEEMDLTANLAGTTVIDQNGEKCALIKIMTTIVGLNFDAGSLGVTQVIQKTSQVWVYVPRGVRKLTISHQKYGTLQYVLPITTQKARTYIMTLKVEKKKDANSQRLTIKCVPQSTVVSIDNEMIDMKDGLGDVTLKLGTHKYIAMANGYYSSEGTITLKADRPGRLSIDLEPNEGTTSEDVKAAVKGTKTPTAYNSSDIAVSFDESPEKTTVHIGNISFDMIKVDGGTFTMGATKEMKPYDPGSYEKPTHQVTLSSFMIGETEVTQGLWSIVMGSNPSSHANGKDYPVESVSWIQANSFINKLNALTGKNFRLPTEAEWEYAARGGNKSVGYAFSGSNDISEVAWFKDNSDNNSKPVKQKKPNELGLYDMTGNVLEWCNDLYDKYSSNSQTNPTGPTSALYRVFRGGAYGSEINMCHTSRRMRQTASKSFIDLGFRLVLQ